MGGNKSKAAADPAKSAPGPLITEQAKQLAVDDANAANEALGRCFALIDKNGDGRLKMNELFRAMTGNKEVMALVRRSASLRSLAKQCGNALAIKAVYQCMVNEAAGEGEKEGISLEGFKEYALLRQLFDFIDVDGSGGISKKEMLRSLNTSTQCRALMKSNDMMTLLRKWMPNCKDVMSIMWEMDADNNKAVDFVEFRDFFRSRLRAKRAAGPEVESVANLRGGAGGVADSAAIVRSIVRAARDDDGSGESKSLIELFNDIDKDRSGEIDGDEFETFVKEQAARHPNGPQPTSEEIAGAFAFVDQDGSGEIDCMEFYNIFA